MKKLILSAFMVSAFYMANAQTASTDIKVGNFSNQVITDSQIREMANKMELNEGNYIKFRDLSRSRREQMEEINSMYSNDPAMRQSKINALNKDFDSQLAQSFSQKQFTAYMELQGRPVQSGTSSSFEAGGYGGRSLEGSGTAVPANNSENDNANLSSTDKVIVTEDKVKINSNSGDMKVTSEGEKVSTSELEYKSDADESKVKAKDNTYKSKSEKGKTKFETKDGKLKIEDDKAKLKAGGKKIKL